MTVPDLPNVPHDAVSGANGLEEQSKAVNVKYDPKTNQKLLDINKTEVVKSLSNVNELIQISLHVYQDNLRVEEALKQLPSTQANTAVEIFQLLSMSEFEITNKFKTDFISSDNLNDLLAKTQNLSLALKCFTNSRNKKALQIIKNNSLSTLDNFEKFKRLATKSYLVSPHALSHILDDIVSSSVYKKTQVRIQFEVIAFLATQGINPTKLISQLGNVTPFFNCEDEKFQERFILCLRKFNISAVYQFLCHLDSERIRVALCNQIIQDLSVDEVADYFKWLNPEPEFSQLGIYKRIIVPSIENFIKWGTSLEELLNLWPHLVNPDRGFNLSELKVKFKQLIGRDGYLPESLRDGAVPVLQNENQALKDELKETQEITVRLKQELTFLTELNGAMKSDLEQLRISRLENSRVAKAGQEAIERQIKIDTLRGLVPAFEKALTSDAQGEVSRILEDYKIEKVGNVGQKIRWNALICESLTGEEIFEGIVVKTGFTWFDGKEVVPLRRMLLKSE